MEEYSDLNNEPYGDLTDKEYLSFLNEIKSGDEELEETQNESSEKIELEEIQNESIEEEVQSESTEEAQNELPIEEAQNKSIEEAQSESEENARIEAYYGDDAWQAFGNHFHGKPGMAKVRESLRRGHEVRHRKLKEDRIAIQRMAFGQEYIRLSDTIGSDNLKLLITLLTAEHTRMIDKYANYINRRLAVLIYPLIPRRLRTCKMLYPESIRECPGFLYKASEEYGEGQSFWAMPDIPYYFIQNTEQAILRDSTKYTNYLIAVDKAVAAYNAHINARQKKELKYASMLIDKHVNSYFDLLRLNPFWFEILFKNLKDKIDSL